MWGLRKFCGQTQGDSCGLAWAASDSILSPTSSCGGVWYLHGSTWLSPKKGGPCRHYCTHMAPGFVPLPPPSQLVGATLAAVASRLKQGRVSATRCKGGLHGAALPAAAHMLLCVTGCCNPNIHGAVAAWVLLPSLASCTTAFAWLKTAAAASQIDGHLY